ncbi:MAG: hypothetical protein ACYS0G_08695 [Planctomycetota bacterium]|jgi:hypothetical protein
MLCSLALGCAMVLTAPSSAQFGLSSGIGDAFRPGFTTRDVQLAVEMLNLDEAQRFILETLFDDYQTEFSTGVDRFRQGIADMRSEIDPENPDPGQVMRVVFGTIEGWQKESQVLVTQLYQDLKGLLNEEQLESWPAFERRLFRLKYLNNGRLAAESLDLLAVVRELNLAQSQMEAVQPLLDEYEVSLDEALRRRQEYANTSQTQLIRAIQDQDPQVGITVAEREVELRKAVRDVNEHYAAAIADALPEEVQERFRKQVGQRAHPRVYRLTQTQRIFSAAKELDGLAEESLTAIEQLEQQYLAELEAFNQQLLQLTREHEPRALRHKVEMAAARMAGRRPDRLPDPLRDQFSKRREMGDRYVQQLRALLTPEQFAALPGARRWLPPDERAAVKVKEGKSIAPSLRRGPTTQPGEGSGGKPNEGKGNE